MIDPITSMFIGGLIGIVAGTAGGSSNKSQKKEENDEGSASRMLSHRNLSWPRADREQQTLGQMLRRFEMIEDTYRRFPPGRLPRL